MIHDLLVVRESTTNETPILLVIFEKLDSMQQHRGRLESLIQREIFVKFSLIR